MKVFLKHQKLVKEFEYTEATVEELIEYTKQIYSLDQVRLLYCGSQLKSGTLNVKDNSTILVMGTPSVMQQHRSQFEDLQKRDLKPVAMNEYLIQLLLKVDGITCNNELERAKRKELVQDIQRVLDTLGFK